MPTPIYLDYNATTPVDDRVVAAMLPYLAQHFGNASSAHDFGYAAHAALEDARGRVAAFVGARPREVVFTGGGSETDNLVLKGVVFPALEKRPHVVSVVTEHPAILATLSYLHTRFGVECTLLPVDEFARVSVDDVRRAITPRTVLVSMMHANNEVGTVQPIDAVAEVCRDAGIPLHVDAAQSLGKIPVDVAAMGIDLLTVAGHKLYAPKGVGALIVRSGIELDPLVHGSNQEHGIRAGTENVAAAVALGTACDLAADELPHESLHLTALRDRLHQTLAAHVPGLRLNGHPTERLPNTLNVSFPGVTGQLLLACAAGLAASTGSACHSAMATPSPVLSAMGVGRERALGAVRLSLGRWSTADEADRAAALLIDAYRSLVGNPAAAHQ